MSRGNSSTTPSSESKTPSGGEPTSQPIWTTRRVAGNGYLHTSTIAGRDVTARQNGVRGYQGWFQDQPARTWTLVNGSLDELAAMMAASLIEQPVVTVFKVCHKGHEYDGRICKTCWDRQTRDYGPNVETAPDGTRFVPNGIVARMNGKGF